MGFVARNWVVSLDGSAFTYEKLANITFSPRIAHFRQVNLVNHYVSDPYLMTHRIKQQSALSKQQSVLLKQQSALLKYGLISTCDLPFLPGLENRLSSFSLSAIRSIGSQVRELDLTKLETVVIIASLYILILLCLSFIPIYIYFVRRQQQSIVEQRHTPICQSSHEGVKGCKTWCSYEANGILNVSQ